MTLIQFMSDHWFVSLLMLYIVCQTVLKLVLLSWSRFMRHLNIRKHGWPPAHCDADGDFKPAPEEAEPEPVSLPTYWSN